MMKIEDKKQIYGLKVLLPFISCILLVLIMVQSFKVENVTNLMPFLTLIAVYQWSVYVPKSMPPIAVFLIGILQDILSGGPLGMTALLLLSVRLIVLGQGGKLLGRDFLFNWLMFLLISFAYAILSWLIVSFYFNTWQSIWFVLGQAIITVGFFPVIFLLFGPLRKLFNVAV